MTRCVQLAAFNELTDAVDLGLEVCRQFLTRTPACKVISIHLPGKYQAVEMHCPSLQHVVPAPTCGLVPPAFSRRLALCVFF